MSDLDKFYISCERLSANLSGSTPQEESYLKLKSDAAESMSYTFLALENLVDKQEELSKANENSSLPVKDNTNNNTNANNLKFSKIYKILLKKVLSIEYLQVHSPDVPGN